MRPLPNVINTDAMDSRTALAVLRMLAGRSLKEDPVAQEARRQAMDVLTRVQKALVTSGWGNVEKAIQYKYLRRYPAKNGRWRYVYPNKGGDRHGEHTVSGKRLDNEAHFQKGSMFSAGSGKGHYVIDAIEGDKVSFHLDDTDGKGTPGKAQQSSLGEFKGMVAQAHPQGPKKPSQEAPQAKKEKPVEQPKQNKQPEQPQPPKPASPSPKKDSPSVADLKKTGEEFQAQVVKELGKPGANHERLASLLGDLHRVTSSLRDNASPETRRDAQAVLDSLWNRSEEKPAEAKLSQEAAPDEATIQAKAGAKKIGQGAYGRVYRDSGPPPRALKYGKVTQEDYEVGSVASELGIGPKIHGGKPAGDKEEGSLSMEFLEGHQTMRQVLEGAGIKGQDKAVAEGGQVDLAPKNLTEPQKQALFDAVSKTFPLFEKLHTAGYAHNDGHVDNILFSSSGEAKLIDFGLATKGFDSAVAELDSPKYTMLVSYCRAVSPELGGQISKAIGKAKDRANAHGWHSTATKGILTDYYADVNKALEQHKANTKQAPVAEKAGTATPKAATATTQDKPSPKEQPKVESPQEAKASSKQVRGVFEKLQRGEMEVDEALGHVSKMMAGSEAARDEAKKQIKFLFGGSEGFMAHFSKALESGDSWVAKALEWLKHA